MNELFKDDIVKDFRTNNFISKKEEIKCIFESQSHAKLTFGNVTIFYNEIVQQIKTSKIKFEVNSQITKAKSIGGVPEFVFRVKISIDTNLNDIVGSFPCELGDYNSKDDAQKCCYFYVLDVLNNNNYLDKHFKFHKK